MDFQFGEVDDLSTVPEPFRPLYGTEAQDGKYVVRPEYAGAASAYLGLNKSLKAAREDAKRKTPVDLAPLSSYGQTPEEIAKTVKAKIDELETSLSQGDKAKLNLDKVREELTKAHQAELGALKSREEALLAEIRASKVDAQAVAAIADQKGDPELLLPFVMKSLQVVEEDGKFNVYVVDGAGDRRYSGVTGQPMTIAELVKEMKANAKFSRLFEAEQQRGGGGLPPGSGSGSGKRSEGNVSSVTRISRGLANRNGR